MKAASLCPAHQSLEGPSPFPSHVCLNGSVEVSARRGLARTACVCVSDASGLFGRRVNQSQSNQQACIVLMLRRPIVRSGRFLPRLSAVICMHSGRRFVLQRRIWPKYNFKGDAPPSVSSAGRIFAARGAFISACLLRDARLFFPLVCSCSRLYHHQTGVCRGAEQQDCSSFTSVSAVEMSACCS